MVKISENLNSDLIEDKLSVADPWYQLIMKMLQPAVHDFKGRRVIEIGCGLGGFLVNTARRGAMVVGLDVSSKAIRIARKLVNRSRLQSNVELVVGDAQFLPFREESGDIVVCSETLEHVPDYEIAFGELVRIARKSGYLCLTVPNFLSTAFFENVVLLLIGQPGYVQSHVCVEKEHVFHLFKLRRLLAQENVKVIAVRSVDFLHLPPRVRRILNLSWSLRLISDQLESFFEDYVSPLRLMGANIGVLAKKG